MSWLDYYRAALLSEASYFDFGDEQNAWSATYEDDNIS